MLMTAFHLLYSAYIHRISHRAVCRPGQPIYYNVKNNYTHKLLKYNYLNSLVFKSF